MKYFVGLLLAFTAIAFLATPGHAKVSVILECTLNGAKESNHDLYEIDYDARTVRNHRVNDDGAPALFPDGSRIGENTFPIQISNNEIKWSNVWNAGRIYSMLGRYSGTLTNIIYTINEGRWNDPSTTRYHCHPYAPIRRKQF
jgi:hypothetical protein